MHSLSLNLEVSPENAILVHINVGKIIKLVADLGIHVSGEW